MRALTDISSGLSILQRKENKRMKIRREMFFISRLLLTGSPRSLRLLGVILCIFENGTMGTSSPTLFPRLFENRRGGCPRPPVNKICFLPLQKTTETLRSNISRIRRMLNFYSNPAKNSSYEQPYIFFNATITLARTFNSPDSYFAYVVLPISQPRRCSSAHSFS